MLYSTVELISQASSNSLAAFCFCNFLIAILLVGNLKPSSQFREEEKLNELPTVPDEDNVKKHAFFRTQKSNDLIVEAEEENASSVSITIVDDDDEEERLNEDEDELRKRVEEFIDKINRGWRAEKFKIHALGQ